MVSLAEKTHGAEYLQTTYQVSERRACQILSINRNTKRSYECKKVITDNDEKVIELSKAEPRWGYRKVYDRLKLDNVRIGRETVRLIRKREGLQVRKKQHKKRHPGPSGLLSEATYPHHVWCYDFVFDSTEESRRLKCLTIVDEYSRIGLKIECARSITAKGVIQVLNDLFAT